MVNRLGATQNNFWKIGLEISGHQDNLHTSHVQIVAKTYSGNATGLSKVKHKN